MGCLIREGRRALRSGASLPKDDMPYTLHSGCEALSRHRRRCVTSVETGLQLTSSYATVSATVMTRHSPLCTHCSGGRRASLHFSTWKDSILFALAKHAWAAAVELFWTPNDLNHMIQHQQDVISISRSSIALPVGRWCFAYTFVRDQCGITYVHIQPQSQKLFTRCSITTRNFTVHTLRSGDERDKVQTREL